MYNKKMMTLYSYYKVSNKYNIDHFSIDKTSFLEQYGHFHNRCLIICYDFYAHLLCPWWSQHEKTSN